ncbi:NAD(P)-dependent oxidoreductase [Microbacterium sp. EST19A]|uniref:NAD(P)-dependent oxidoreductase n=1 Tax=Microbacterium sp. EST19A TaxID=2862681 RepID=UPI001CBC4299|nr:NAD(P)-binding domain-containing protein [Microbacterium sp. EST19A]
MIGVVGLGRMGTPITEALRRDLPVGVFDADLDRRGAVPGARWFPTLPALAEAVDVLITVLPGPRELSACMADALPALSPGSLWIDLTSGDPVVTRDLAERSRRLDIDVVSAPMGGSVGEVKAGGLVFFVSGQDSAVAKAIPILRRLSRRDGIRRTGARAEDGQIVKLLANGLWFANAVAAAEAMLIGQSLGIPSSELHALLRDSAGGSRFLDDHLDKLLEGDYFATFGIDRVVEELDTIAAMSASAGVATPMLDASAALHHQALDRFGPVLGELLTVRLLEASAGQQLRRDPAQRGDPHQ